MVEHKCLGNFSIYEQKLSNMSDRELKRELNNTRALYRVFIGGGKVEDPQDIPFRHAYCLIEFAKRLSLDILSKKRAADRCLEELFATLDIDDTDLRRR